MRQLFEVGGAEDAFRPSPYCWRVRMALAHKELSFEPVPWRAVEKDRIARSGGGTVPVLVDHDRWIRESWDIACVLEANNGGPPLFSGEGDQTKARFLDHWVTLKLHPIIFRAVAMDQFPMLAAKDQDYYLERTKRKFGKTLSELCGDPEMAIRDLEPLLHPLQNTLSDAAFLGGASPNYSDYVVFGAFQWARVASERQLYAPDSALADWFGRLLAAHDGFAQAQPSRAHWPADGLG